MDADRIQNSSTNRSHDTSSTMVNKHRFLVIEDESDIAELIALHLDDLDADVTIASNGNDGLKMALDGNWDAILLDLKLPGLDGIEVCRQIRSESDFVPIMMLTSRDTELDRVLGLEIGADDYLTKPFSVPELKARVKALVRRSKHATKTPVPQDVIEHPDFFMDKKKRTVSIASSALQLTAKEFDLLWFFAKSPGEVFNRSQLLDKVWGYGHDGYEHTVNSHINRLRSKLEKHCPTREYIETVWGVGYRFKAQAEIN